MNSDARLLARMRELCAEIGAEDGIDPRLLEKRSRHRGPSRKTQQLCGQVSRAISLALASSAEPCLQALTVARVCPAPDVRRLRFELTSTDPRILSDPGATLARVAAAAGWLRTEVGAGLSRRRVPGLVFHWRPPVEVEP